MFNKMKSRSRRLAPLVAFLLVLSGCASDSPPKPKTFAYADEAASVHMAVLSVGRWDDYVAALQPAFTLSEQGAFDQVVATTRAQEDSFVDSFKLGLKVGLPTSTSTSSQTTQLRDGTETVSSDTTVARGPGTVPAEIPATGVDRGSASANLPSETILKAANVAVDPMLRFWASTALFQEVKLLNRYVKDVQTRDGMDAYVIRLQVSLMPYARNEPYDVYTQLSFLWADGEGKGSGTEPPVTALAQTTAEPPKTPIVVPLIVTDNLEATLHSVSVERVRQYALALAATINNVGAAANIAKSIDKLNRTLGRDFNSLYSIARVTDNTVRVRLGALQQAETAYATVPRTHNVSLVILAKRTSRETTLNIASLSEIRDARTGTPLMRRPEKRIEDAFQKIVDKYALDTTGSSTSPGTRSKNTTTRELREALRRVQENDWNEFSKVACPNERSCKIVTSSPRSLWGDLAALTNGGLNSATSVELPVPPPFAPFPTQTAVVLDDGEKSADVVLRDARNFVPTRATATLEVETGTEKLSLAATRIDDLGGGRIARLTFPSPLAWVKSAKPVRLDVTLYGLADDPREPCTWDNQTKVAKCTYRAFAPEKPLKKADPKTPGFEIAVSPEFVTCDRAGRGSLNLSFRFVDDPKSKPPRVYYEVIGADIDGATPLTGPAMPSGSPRQVTATGDVKLLLSNLHPATPIRVSAWQGENQDKIPATPIERRVVLQR